MNIEPDKIWVAWLIAGAVIGLAFNLLMPVKRGLVLDLLVGMVGGLLGGLLPAVTGATGATYFTILSIGFAVIGALVTLGALRWLGKGQKLWSKREVQ